MYYGLEWNLEYNNLESYLIKEYNSNDIEHDIYYLYKMLNLLKVKYDEHIIINYNIAEINNIYSLYRIIELIEENDINIPKEIIETFDEYKCDEGGYYMSIEEKNIATITLGNTYYGIIIDYYINTGIWLGSSNI